MFTEYWARKMPSQLLISKNMDETRTALVEDGLLQEVQIERAVIKSLVGNIYKAKVNRIMPGMQAAFVDLGLERAGFLHESDIPSLDKNGIEHRENKEQNIFSKIHEGKTLLVQVIKSPMGAKGARLSAHLSLSARYLVYMPQGTHLGISRRIEGEEERKRLSDLISVLANDQGLHGGFIARTAAEGVDAKEIERDILFFKRQWPKLLAESKTASVPSLVHSDLPLAIRAVRDISATKLAQIRIDNQQVLDTVKGFLNVHGPQLLPLLDHYDEPRPLFDLHSVEEQISRALESVVELKSGGTLVIEQTEAMVTVDVNTGGFVGNRNLEETILATNLEAASSLARQLRLRNLGGLIVVDFIDMENNDHQRQVMRVFESALEHDKATTVVSEFSAFGLIEMTRRRDSQSLGKALCDPCPECLGTAVVKSVETSCFDLYRDFIRWVLQHDSEHILILASEPVVARMQDSEIGLLADMETRISGTITLKVDSQYRQEQYDMFPLLSPVLESSS